MSGKPADLGKFPERELPRHPKGVREKESDTVIPLGRRKTLWCETDKAHLSLSTPCQDQ